MSHSCHHEISTDPLQLKKVIDKVTRKIKALHKVKRIDAIAFSGFSGACVAYPVSVATNIPTLNIRKEEVHHGYTREGPSGYVNNVVIIDDFIQSGKTMNYIFTFLHAISCSGIILYNEQFFSNCESSKENYKKYVTRKGVPVYIVK